MKFSCNKVKNVIYNFFSLSLSYDLDLNGKIKDQRSSEYQVQTPCPLIKYLRRYDYINIIGKTSGDNS